MPSDDDELAKLLADPQAAALIKKYNSAKGKRGASAGGTQRAKSLTPEQRKAIASKGGKAAALKKRVKTKAAGKQKKP